MALHIFCGRVADTRGRDFLFIEAVLAGNLASFFGAMGALYATAGYLGPVDVGMAVLGIEGAVRTLQGWEETGFTGPVPRRTDRVLADELKDRPKTVSLKPQGASSTPYGGATTCRSPKKD